MSNDKYFEPGSIKCADCGWKPEDRWDDCPDDFEKVDGQWFCSECLESDLKDEAGNVHPIFNGILGSWNRGAKW